MSDAFTRSSALANVAIPGRFGADQGAPGVTLSVPQATSLIMVLARAGKGKAVAEALEKLRGARLMWAGPEQWYVQGPTHASLVKALSSQASVVDQSHGRFALRISGPKARAVLAKGTPVDLYTEQFPTGHSVLTQMAHVGVHLTRIGDDEFELSVFRGFAESFWGWLTEMALEFGYQVN
jgi:methylglutamate dehydrogenase subunit D